MVGVISMYSDIRLDTWIRKNLLEACNDAVSECRLAADVVNDFLNERIVIETSAADGIEIFIPAGLVAVGTKTCHGRQVEFLTGVFVDQLVQRHDCVLPLFHYIGGFTSCNPGKINLPVTFDCVIGPCPFVIVVMGENVQKSV